MVEEGEGRVDGCHPTFKSSYRRGTFRKLVLTSFSKSDGPPTDLPASRTKTSTSQPLVLGLGTEIDLRTPGTGVGSVGPGLSP